VGFLIISQFQRNLGQHPSSASLTVNGVLIANGIYVNRISFTSTGSTSPGAWGSIILTGSGANGSTISYADIDYGTEVKINQSDGVTIENCNIMDNSYHGIEVYYGSNFLAQGNTIANSNINHGITITGGSNNNCNYNTIYKYPNVSPGYHNGAGIQYGASSGNVKQNDIDYYNWGIGAIWGASVNSYYSIDNTTRNNRVTNCLYGLMVYRNSYCDFGLQSAQTAYSYNSIYNNAD
jgi:parallel beta-helix repeat protein